MPSKKRFELKKLSTKLNPKDLEKLRESKEEPTKKEPTEKAEKGEQLDFSSTSGGDVWKRKISLSRKKALQEYFHDQQKNSPEEEKKSLPPGEENKNNNPK